MNILKKRYIEVETAATCHMEGIWTLRAVKPGMGVVRETTFKNLITNLGLNALGSSTWEPYRYCNVGTGTNAPAVTDTALQSFLANIGQFSGNPSAGVLANGYVSLFMKATSTVGALGNNSITEISANAVTTNSNAFSRALILDSNGVPTAFPINSDEQLEVTYELRQYWPTTDVAAAISIGQAAYSTTTRALGVTNLYQWAILGSSSSGRRMSGGGGDGTNMFFTGGLAAISANSPLGTAISGSSSPSVSTAAYVNDSFQIDVTWNWGAGKGTGTFRTVIADYVMSGFQTDFGADITKTAAQAFIMNHRLSWARM